MLVILIDRSGRKHFIHFYQNIRAQLQNRLKLQIHFKMGEINNKKKKLNK